jgi:hypothetical protein
MTRKTGIAHITDVALYPHLYVTDTWAFDVTKETRRRYFTKDFHREGL